MSGGTLLMLLKFGTGAALIVLFGVWQLRQLDRDRKALKDKDAETEVQTGDRS
jgi:cytochrome oxidase assembly protein ShyY1